MSLRKEARLCADHFREEYADTMCRVGEVLLSFTCGVLTLVTFGTSFWLQAEIQAGEGVGYHFGLWQNCTISATSVCEGVSYSSAGTSSAKHGEYI